jgi:hypothetical protein
MGLSPADPVAVERQVRKSTKSKDSAPLIVPRPKSHVPPLQKMISLTVDDLEAVKDYFGVSEAMYSYLFLIIAGADPPESPITVKNLIVEFYSKLNDFRYAPGEGGNPTVPDPIPEHQRIHYDGIQFPTVSGLEAIISSLSASLNLFVESVAVYLHLLIVELDIEELELNRLPGRVAGRIVL